MRVSLVPLRLACSVCFRSFWLGSSVCRAVRNEWNEIEQNVCCAAVLAELVKSTTGGSMTHGVMTLKRGIHVRQMSAWTAALWMQSPLCFDFCIGTNAKFERNEWTRAQTLCALTVCVSGHGKWHILRASKQYSGHFEIHHTLTIVIGEIAFWQWKQIVYSFVEAYTRHVHRTHTVKRLIYISSVERNRASAQSTAHGLLEIMVAEWRLELVP